MSNVIHRLALDFNLLSLKVMVGVGNCEADHVKIFANNPELFIELLLEGEFRKLELDQHVDIAQQV